MSDKELIQKIYDKQEKISEDMGEVKVTLARQEENIRTHIRRTELAEMNIESLRKEIEPVKTHVKMIQGALKFIGLAGVGATMLSAIVQLLRFLSGS